MQAHIGLLTVALLMIEWGLYLYSLLSYNTTILSMLVTSFGGLMALIIWEEYFA